MIFSHTVSSRLAWIGDRIIRLATWVGFSVLYYNAHSYLPLRFQGNMMVGGNFGIILDLIHVALWIAYLYLYLYCSFRIFRDKNLFINR